MRHPLLLWTLILLRSAIAFAGEPATRPVLLGRIELPAITESSGVIESRRFPGVYWTHNDSGNAPVIYAIDRNGKSIAQFTVRATNRDWEDIAIDDQGSLYIGEIGNNGARFAQIAVYRMDEPDPRAKPDAPLKLTGIWQLRFPGNKPFDCESLFIDKGFGYVISKLFDGRDATLYRFSLTPQTRAAVLEPVTTLPIRLPVTAADLSRDGKKLAVMTVAGPYLFKLGEKGLSDLSTAKPAHVAYFDLHIEAVCFTTGGLLATTEGRDVLLFPYELFEEKN